MYLYNKIKYVIVVNKCMCEQNNLDVIVSLPFYYNPCDEWTLILSANIKQPFDLFQLTCSS